MGNDAIPPDDFLAQLGALALGSRLKRLADALHRDVAGTLAPYGGIAPNCVPVLACLEALGPQGVVDIARRLGVAQPGVTRILAALRSHGLIALARGATDRRQSIVRLTDKGAAMVAEMKLDYWPRVDAAASSLFEGASGDFLAQIAAVECALAERSLARRVGERGG
jgi:DNA-binding MarR family transcriptional regulator